LSYGPNRVSGEKKASAAIFHRLYDFRSPGHRPPHTGKIVDYSCQFVRGKSGRARQIYPFPAASRLRSGCNGRTDFSRAGAALSPSTWRILALGKGSRHEPGGPETARRTGGDGNLPPSRPSAVSFSAALFFPGKKSNCDVDLR